MTSSADRVILIWGPERARELLALNRTTDPSDHRWMTDDDRAILGVTS